jgi:hypothetical protein
MNPKEMLAKWLGWLVPKGGVFVAKLAGTYFKKFFWQAFELTGR